MWLLCLSEVRNVAFVSENEGSDLGIPWPDAPPSSDCPVGWHTDGAPRRPRVRGRGSRPVLAQNQGVRVPIPAGAFYAPQNTPQGVFVQLKCCFGGTGLPEPGEPAAAVGGTGRSSNTNRFL